MDLELMKLRFDSIEPRSILELESDFQEKLVSNPLLRALEFNRTSSSTSLSDS
jgi:hypothetical protein